MAALASTPGPRPDGQKDTEILLPKGDAARELMRNFAEEKWSDSDLIAWHHSYEQRIKIPGGELELVITREDSRRHHRAGLCFVDANGERLTGIEVTEYFPPSRPLALGGAAPGGPEGPDALSCIDIRPISSAPTGPGTDKSALLGLLASVSPTLRAQLSQTTQALLDLLFERL